MPPGPVAPARRAGQSGKRSTAGGTEHGDPAGLGEPRIIRLPLATGMPAA